MFFNNKERDDLKLSLRVLNGEIRRKDDEILRLRKELKESKEQNFELKIEKAKTNKEDERFVNRAYYWGGACYYGCSLKSVDEIYKDENYVVELAVMHDGLNLEFASDRLKRNKLIVSYSLEQNFESYKYADKSVFKNIELVKIIAEKQRALLLQCDIGECENLLKKIMKAIEEIIFIDCSDDDLVDLLKINPYSASCFQKVLDEKDSSISDLALNLILDKILDDGLSHSNFLFLRKFITGNSFISNKANDYKDKVKETIKKARWSKSEGEYIVSSHNLNWNICEDVFACSDKIYQMLFDESFFMNDDVLRSIFNVLLHENKHRLYNLFEKIVTEDKDFPNSDDLVMMSIILADEIYKANELSFEKAEFSELFFSNSQALKKIFNKWIYEARNKIDKFPFDSFSDVVEKVDFNNKLEKNLLEKNQKQKVVKI